MKIKIKSSRIISDNENIIYQQHLTQRLHTQPRQMLQQTSLCCNNGKTFTNNSDLTSRAQQQHNSQVVLNANVGNQCKQKKKGFSTCSFRHSSNTHFSLSQNSFFPCQTLVEHTYYHFPAFLDPFLFPHLDAQAAFTWIHLLIYIPHPVPKVCWGSRPRN